ncbi:helix-turn-helix domain-containing protein [Flavobacteriaceae bacterium R38]|nr:helix-turn-helix domain-containing protein [Flavobacteriaceae bacterium R38]
MFEAENWNYVLRGINLCIGIQLLILSFLKLFQQSKRDKILGLFTLLLAIAYMRVLLIEFVSGIPLARVLLLNSLEIFFPPLLYLYIISSNNSDFKLRKHMLFPFFYVLMNIVLKIFLADFYADNRAFLVVLNANIIVLNFIVYFWLGIQAFRKNLDISLKDKARLKFRFFYYIINIYEILNGAVNSISVTTKYASPEANEILTPVLLGPGMRLTLTLIGVIQALFLIFHILTESQFFKDYYLGKNIEKNKSLILEGESLKQKIEKIITEHQLFKDPELNLKNISKKIEVNPTIVMEYFSQELKMSFNDYINRFRVNEFKKLMMLKENEKYDIMGIAELAGFKSRATFYRNFRRIEGVSPKEYKERIQSEEA